jgi:DNA-binding NtrC family response regulator
MNNKLYPEYPILLVDDEKNTLRSYELALQSINVNNFISCENGLKARDIVKSRNIELIILDMMMPGISGDKLLEEFSVDYPEIPIIMVTCVNTLEKAVKCMQLGAAEYLDKPVNINILLDKIAKYLEINEINREARRLKNAALLNESREHSKSFAPIITESKTMRQLFNYCSSIASNRLPVMICGETGVGKELFARALYEESGCPGKLITVNIAGLDDNMISDTLFGHKKGAFTGAMNDRPGAVELASNGALFIDEIGDLNMPSQIKLLRLLQQREYTPLGSDKVKKTSAKIILATHRDLQELQRDKKFRKDLYYRISAHHIDVPPLRERKDDLVLLLNYFIKKAAKELEKKIPSYPNELITLLRSYHFPGNIRELEGMVYDAVSSHGNKMLSTKVFLSHMKRNSKNGVSDNLSGDNIQNCLMSMDTLPNFKEMDKMLIEEALRRSEGNQRVAAGMLGVTPQALSSRLKKMDLKN